MFLSIKGISKCVPKYLHLYIIIQRGCRQRDMDLCTHSSCRGIRTKNNLTKSKKIHSFYLTATFYILFNT